MSQQLTREVILATQDLKTERVEVPEWGGHVFVRTMTGTERDAFEGSVYGTRGREAKANFENLRARLVVLVAVDEDGKRLFADEDAPALGGKSVSALDRIFEAAQRLNGITAKDIEELAGNSGPGRKGATTSALHPVSG